VWAAAEASSLPRGGVSLVAQATRSVANYDSRRHPRIAAAQSKAPGGGTKPQSGPGGVSRSPFHHPKLPKALEQLVEPVVRGDPESFLRWTSKSTRKLAAELRRQGYEIGDRKVA